MLAAVATIGCGDSGAGPVDELDAGGDAAELDAGSVDAGERDSAVAPLDAGGDPTSDGGQDAGADPDAGEPDAGPDCECSSGPCCDGCSFRPVTHRCATEVVYSSRCTNPSEACPGYHDRISEDFGDIYCPGDAATCTGEIDHVRTVSRSCWSSSSPFFCSGPEGDAACDHSCE